MEKNEKCFIISIPFNSISWLKLIHEKANFRIYGLPIVKKIDEKDRVAFQVAILNENGSSFVDQSEKGIQYNGDYCMFKSQTKTEITGFKIEFSFDDEDKQKMSSFIVFDDKSPGRIQSPIVDSGLNVVGTIKIHFLIIKPYPFELDNESCSAFDTFLKKGIHVGHRGAGASRRDDLSDNILENTILSLNHAIKHGADMVEFDVHLSKDDVPIVYHDFSVYVSLTKKGSNDIERLELPVKDLTYQQLKMLKLEPKRDDEKMFEISEDDIEDNQPFCKLEHALNTVSPCAFNVEVKYPTGSGFYKDLNHFVDTILKTIFDHHNNRDIVFSSFDPDICAMIHLKQKKFPVLFLTYTEDRNVKIVPIIDDNRCDSVEMACYYAVAMSFSGINCYGQNLISDKSLVKYVINKGLLLYCYGGTINTTSIVADLIKEGVNGVIYDRIDVISPKKLVEATTAAANQDGDTSPPPCRKTSATIFSVDKSS